MIEMKTLTMSPWDFTLYATGDRSRVMKVMFSEGDYKVDIERLFLIAGSQLDESLDELKKLASKIRSEYPAVAYPEIMNADVAIIE